MKLINSISVLGAGTWGLALANVLADNGHKVTVWSHNEQAVKSLTDSRKSPNLPEVKINDTVDFSNNFKISVEGKDIIVIAVPSSATREISKKLNKYIKKGQIIVDVAKGIEKDSLLTLSEVIKQEIEYDIPIVVLSGPTHAEEVAKKLHTTIVSSHKDKNIAEIVQKTFSNDYFRVYTNNDPKGVEISGAIKNVIALASGIATGIGLGDNAKAAIITRGLNEITMLGGVLGCNPKTFYGLAGMGDLIVTCSSEHSRNFRCGRLIGQGIPVEDAIKSIGMVVEGIKAIPATIQLASKYEIEMPICEAVNSIVKGRIKPVEALDMLFKRELKSENHNIEFKDIWKNNKIIKDNTSMKRVITYGTFDLLHYGHINILRRAKELGDYLVVVLSSDEFNWNEKQKKCYFSYEQRKQLLEAVRYVDLVIPENSWDQKVRDVHDYHIDTFVMGDDWKGKFDFLKDEGVEVIYLERTPEISTTQIKKDLNK